MFVGFVHGVGTDADEVAYALVHVVVDDAFDAAYAVALHGEHGGEDGGAVGKNGALEKELNLSISKKLHDLFRAAGYKVVMTRETDTLLYDKNADYKGRKKELDLAKRVEIANSYELLSRLQVFGFTGILFKKPSRLRRGGGKHSEHRERMPSKE